MADPRIVSDRFELIRELGSGAHKRVWLAHDSVLGREVALAIFRPEAFSASDLAHVRREAKILAAFNHPNIVAVHDLIEEEELCYLVTEFVEGGSLKDRMSAANGGHLDLNQTLRLVAEVADALSVVHAEGIFHRDVKPSNVLVDADDTARLGDFGLARPLGQASLGDSGVIVGTVPYMSPEQAKGLPPDSPADMYSLGVVLYEMIAGRRPFHGEDASVLVHHLETLPPKPSRYVPECSGRLEQLVLRLLDKSPAVRPDAQQTAEALRVLRAAPEHGGRATAGTEEPGASPEGYRRVYAAVVMADVAGYSRLVGKDEDVAQDDLNWCLDCIKKSVADHSGQIMHFAGDAVHARFNSDLDALTCAIKFQIAINARSAERSGGSRFLCGVGINSGHVLEDRGEIWGDNVNIAARLEAFADPGGICISSAVLHAVGKQLVVKFEDAGLQHFKNIADPVHAYRVRADSGRASVAPSNPEAELRPGSDRVSIQWKWGAVGPGLVAVAALVAWLLWPPLVPMEAACAIDKRAAAAAVIAEGAAPDWLPGEDADGGEVLAAFIRSANSELYEHLATVRERDHTGTSHRGITYVWGPPGVGKSPVAREALSGSAASGCKVKLSEYPFAHERTDLATRDGKITFNRLPAAGARDYDFDALLRHFGCTNGDDVLPFVVVDGLDEVHPTTSTRVLKSLDDFVLDAEDTGKPFVSIVVFGRPEAFAPWYRAAARLGAEIEPLLRDFELTGPTYSTTGALRRFAVTRCQFMGVKCNDASIQAYVDYVRRNPFLGYSIRSLPLSTSILKRWETHPGDSELELKAFLFTKLLSRGFQTHGRPGPGDALYPQYRRALEDIAARYAAAGQIDAEGFFSVADEDAIDTSPGESLNVRRTLNRSGITVSKPASHAASTRIRFEPAWVLGYLVELHNRRHIPWHRNQGCYT